jgi:quercetin dioxygenase-like cupin family protein
MNIKSALKFDEEKPGVFLAHNTENIKIIAIGLLKNQVLAKHKTNIPTLLTVLNGKITFRIEEKEILLSRYDTFHIPVDVLHSVLGNNKKNIFTLTQEKSKTIK